MSNEILIHFVLLFIAQLCNVTLQKASIFIPYSSLITPWPWEHPWCTSIFGFVGTFHNVPPLEFHRFSGFPMGFPWMFHECSMIFQWHFPMILPHPPVSPQGRLGPGMTKTSRCYGIWAARKTRHGSRSLSSMGSFEIRKEWQELIGIECSSD